VVTSRIMVYSALSHILSHQLIDVMMFMSVCMGMYDNRI
jgi:hypothetical protein